MYLRITFVLCVYLSCLSIDTANALEWPKCGEFVFPEENTNLSAEEKQFRRKLPSLFKSFDSGNYSDIEITLRSLEQFQSLQTSDIEYLERQKLSPSLEIVSVDSIFALSIDLNVWFLFWFRPNEFKTTDIRQVLTKLSLQTATFCSYIALETVHSPK